MHSQNINKFGFSQEWTPLWLIAYNLQLSENNSFITDLNHCW